MLAEEDMAASAIALDAAQDAIDALDDSNLRPMMLHSLQLAVAAVQQPRILRGQRPGMAHQHQWVESLATDSELRPSRAAVFVAMKALFDLVWRPMTSTERSQRLRSDTAKRMEESCAEVERQHVVRMGVLSREICMIEADAALSGDERERQRRERREREDRKEHANEWLGVGTVLRRCGLGHLASGVGTTLS